MTLENLCEVAYDLAAKILIPTKEELMANFIFVKEDDSWDVVHCPWGDDKEKHEAIRLLGRTVIGMKEQVQCYSMLTEVWMSHYRRGEAKRGAPVDDPQRREGVIALASDGETHLFRSWEIGRDPTGRCVSLTYTENPGRFESWMTEALDQALAMQRFKRRIVDEYKATGKVSGLDAPGVPEKVKAAIKAFIEAQNEPT